MNSLHITQLRILGVNLEIRKEIHLKSFSQKLIAATLLFGTMALQSPGASFAQTLYGVTGAGGAVSNLYTVNPLTGATTLVGSTGFAHVTGLDFDPTSGILYGVVSDISNSVAKLITIDSTTGVGTAIGDTGNQIPDFTIGPDGVIRGWTEGGAGNDDLVVLDKNTGVGTITSSSLRTSQTGVAYESPTSVYVKPSTDLYSVNVNTGVQTLLFSLGISNADNILENAPDGTLITGSRDRTGTQLYRIDVGSGLTTALGHSSQKLSALAYSVSAVPEPSALALFGIGVAGIGVLSRRRRKKS